jgi:hypothetical protein
MRYDNRISLSINMNFIIIIALSFTGIANNSTYSNVVWVFILICVLLQNEEDTLYFLTGLSIFEYSISFQSRIVLFPFFIGAALKIIIKKGGLLSKHCFICFFVLLLLEIINDLIRVPMLNTINLISIIFYAIIVMDSVSKLNIDIKKYTTTYYYSYLVAVIATIVSYGSFSSFIYTLQEVDYSRFGATTRYLTGGAMGIPLYSLIVLTIELSCLEIVFKGKSIARKIWSIVIISTTLVIGIFSQSRIFIVCLLAIVVWLIINSYKTKGKTFIPIIVVSIVAITVVLTQRDLIELFIGRITKRFDTVFLMDGTSRADIYLSCFDYLRNNPIHLLFGKGNIYYSNYGSQFGFAFGKTAHNLFLDGLMGYGIIGLSCILSVYLRFSKILMNKFGKKTTLTSMPLFIYLIHSMTADAFTVSKTWLILIILICYKYIESQQYALQNE